MPKNAKEFVCELCDFKCYKNSNYLKHLETLKHKNQHNINQKPPKSFQETIFNCNCGKNYKERSGLWRHKKVCTYIEQNQLKKEDKEEFMLSLIKNEIATIVNNQIVSTNESNKNSRYTRNYIRNELMPHALHVNPGLHTLVKKIVEGKQNS